MLTIDRNANQKRDNDLNCSEIIMQGARELCEMKAYLDDYKRTHHTYPVSSWIARLRQDNSYNPEWPIDVGLDSNNQYYYISTGAHFKLINTHPYDCEEVRKIYPSMVLPSEECDVYGYWSPGAVNW